MDTEHASRFESAPIFVSLPFESNQREGNIETPFDLNQTLSRIAHWLPSQGPIKDFIHHNTLHAFQDLPFHDAISVASRLFGAKDYLSLDEYRFRYRNAEITEEAIERALASYSGEERNSLRKQLLEWPDNAPSRKGLPDTGVRSLWWTRHGVELNRLVQPLLFRLISNFFDQGVSIWRMPHASSSLWQAVGRLCTESKLPIPPLTDRRVLPLLGKPSDGAIVQALERIVGDPQLYEQYLLEMLLAHPGWSGMVATVEHAPSGLLAARRASLQEFVATELMIELGWLERDLGPDFIPLGKRESIAPRDYLKPVSSPESKLRRIWFEAMEWSYYLNLLSGLESHNRTAKDRTPATVNFQAFFCIDDRSSSIRRHFEEIEPTIETFGTAGFFGIDMLYQKHDEIHPTQLCPVVLTPRHLIRELSERPRPRFQRHGIGSSHVPINTNTLFRGWLLSQVMGLAALFRLALNVFRPGALRFSSPHAPKVPTSLQIYRKANERSPEGYLLGYSLPEMVERVGNVLRSSGLVDNFAPLVVMVGHGSTSTNNPHFSAYDCGACSGRPGSPNARVFAWMANHPEVREALRKTGIPIPERTRFLGAIHDTSRDEITYFDSDDLPSSHREAFVKFDLAITQALQRNALERTRRFELTQFTKPENAHAHVKARSESIFEPRPELNHATNAAAIVGRRSLTRGLFLDRRAFMNSYRWDQDPEGKILTSILNAVVPVCGGINLEYLFSRIDNEAYGAGTKLPHNVVGLIGVANGVEGDLRTGLPSQMIEVHDPVRLMIIVEQTPEVALLAARRNPAVFEWIEHGWVQFSCLCPKERKIWLFRDGTMARIFDKEPPPVPVAPDSLSIVKGRRGNIPVTSTESPR